jgi:hypothetical protein
MLTGNTCHVITTYCCVTSPRTLLHTLFNICGLIYKLTLHKTSQAYYQGFISYFLQQMCTTGHRLHFPPHSVIRLKRCNPTEINYTQLLHNSKCSYTGVEQRILTDYPQLRPNSSPLSHNSNTTLSLLLTRLLFLDQLLARGASGKLGWQSGGKSPSLLATFTPTVHENSLIGSTIVAPGSFHKDGNNTSF